jgi:quercetin dioxygenase-like cupin family protein
MNPYPEMIMNLPEIDVNLSGVRGWLLRNEFLSAVFFKLDPIAKIPPHSHCAQWGMVLEGKMKLTIDGKTKLYTRGDRYFIPRDVVHSAEFVTQCFVVDYFEDPKRYHVKNS